jgi:hypothetical protein
MEETKKPPHANFERRQIWIDKELYAELKAHAASLSVHEHYVSVKEATERAIRAYLKGY